MNSDSARSPASDPDESEQDSNQRRSGQDSKKQQTEQDSKKQTEEDSKDGQKSAKKLDLSLTQVIGGSLAAATVAALSSKLGVAGTIIGAAIASFVSAIAASLYTTSIRRTREAAKAVVVRVKRLDGQRATGITVDDLPAVDGAAVRRGPDGQVIGRDASGASGTAVLATQASGRADPDGNDPEGGTAAEAVTSDSDPGDSDQAEELEVEVPVGKPRRLRLRTILVGAGSIFVIAVLGITGYELASGESISGGNRTSLQQIVEGTTTSSSPSEPSDTQDQNPSSSTTAPQDRTSTSTASPTTGESSSTSEATRSSSPSTSTVTEPTTPEGTTTQDQPGAPTGNSKPEAGATTPASPTDNAAPTSP